MYQLSNAETGDLICTLSKRDLRFLTKHLEGDFNEDEEYRLTSAEFEQLEMYEISDGLAEALRRSIDEADVITVFWSRA